MISLEYAQIVSNRSVSAFGPNLWRYSKFEGLKFHPDWDYNIVY